ncbi:CheW protein [Thiomonas sp. X19]|uniref:chemotaxis protein CheW n=1 Tax=Thiomonas sp. X19 TaxID=1050370 RepID=UPI000B6D8AE4|nr:chemotaxis protein CheW [Thiomonas sp. X19]SCC92738.1 CheW protein [Thiomonas sp. X19]
MARSSLIEFQSQLASRLQAAQLTQSESRWLAVVAGQQRILLPLSQAGEISAYEPPMLLPHAQAWFAGLVNLRGVLCGVVDLAAFLGARLASSPRSNAQSRYIQFTPQLEINAVLLVDQLAGLRTPGQFVMDEHSPAATEPWLGPGLLDASGLTWRELNLALLADDPRFLAVV